MDRLRVAVGEEVALDFRGGRTVRVTPHMHEALARIRPALVATAQARAITTYKALNEATGRPYALAGLGPVLDVLRVDCSRRGEPSLPSLVVRKSTHEVGDGYPGDAAVDRAECWHHWDRGSRE
ncbi:MAG: hypothetical protein LPK92_10725 [Actinomycetes bacterium]|nr:hypothetical protein [Actinomycetes bacterium]